LTFQHFESRVLTFDLSIAPIRCQRRSYGRFILFETSRKALQIRNAACLAGCQPSVKFVVLPLSHNLQELLTECVGLLHYRHLAELLKDVGLFRVELLDIPNEQPD